MEPTAEESDPPRVPTRWSALRWVVLATVAGIVLYGVLAAYADMQQVLQEVREFNLWTLPVALGLVLTSYAIRIIRWQMLLRHLGRAVPNSLGAFAFLAGFALSVTPGKLGEVVKAYYLRQDAQVPYRDSLAAVVAERLLDGASIVVLLAVSAAVSDQTRPWAGAVLLTVVIAGLLFLRHPRWVPRTLDVIDRGVLGRRVVVHLRNHHARLRVLLSGGIFVTVGVLGLVAWSLEPIALWALAKGFHVPLSLSACYFCFAVATLAGVITMLPGGLGVTEASLLALLATYGVPLAAATTLVLAFRLCTLWFGVVVGTLSWAGLSARRRTHAVTVPDAPLSGGPKSS